MASEKQSNVIAIENLNRIAPDIRLSNELSAMDSVQLLSKENDIIISVGNDVNSRAAAYILEKFYTVISPWTTVNVEVMNKQNYLNVGSIEMPLSADCSASEFAFSVYDFYTSRCDTTPEQVIQANNLLTSAMLTYLKSGNHTLEEMVHHCAKELNINNMGLFFKGITEVPYDGNPDYQILDALVYAGAKDSIPDVSDKKSWYANDYYERDPEMFINFIQEKKTGRILPEVSEVYVNHHEMCSFFPARVENNGTLTSPFTEKLRQALETVVRVSNISDYSDPSVYTIAMNALEEIEISNAKDNIMQKAVADIKNRITAEYNKIHLAHSEEQNNAEYVTLDDLLNHVKEIEARTKEPEAVTDQIWTIAKTITEKALGNQPVKVVTDYDADGICFAYILDKTLHKIKPDIDLEVICNDRRGSYGVPKYLVPDKDAVYIIGDMGCNEIPYIESTFSEHIVIDHHLIEDADIIEKFNNSPNLLNPHSLTCEDGKSADYCATGLSYRIATCLISAYEEDINRTNKVVGLVNNELHKRGAKYDIIKNACAENGITLYDRGSNTYTATIDDLAVCDIELAARPDGGLEIGKVSVISSHEGIISQNFTYNKQTGIVESPFNEKFRNTIDIIAGIGTVADCVNVLDEHSMNRSIIKNAMLKIDNATQSNIEHMLGCILSVSNIGREDVTAKQIGFSVAPFFNAPSRMSPIIEQNGAQLMYNMLAGEDTLYTQLSFCDMNELNMARKNLKNAIKDEEYYSFVEDHRCGANKDDKLAVYLLPKEVPHTMCGIIASNLTDACDKPAIVFTPKIDPETKETTYVGSARNVPRMESLKDFLDSALSHVDDNNFHIKYGGHSDAVGISLLNDLYTFEQVIRRYQDEFKEKDVKPVRLAINTSEINSPETLSKILALEPLGQGFKLPPVMLEGKEERRSQLFKKGNPHWKTVRIAGAPDIADWDYSASVYPTDKSGVIRTLAELEVSDFNGRHIEAKAVFSKSILDEREKELVRATKSPTISKD